MLDSPAGFKLLAVDKKPTRGGQQDRPRHEAQERTPEFGWVTTQDAAAVLAVSPRTVRDYIRSGALEAKSEGVGVLKRYLVSEDGVQAMVEKRGASRVLSRNLREPAAMSVRSAESSPEPAEKPAEPMVKAQDLQYRLGYADARLDLVERLGSALQAERDRLLEDLKRERKRTDADCERLEELRHTARELERLGFTIRQKAERLEWERDRAQEEARRLREELSTERDKSFRRILLVGLLFIVAVAAVVIATVALFSSQL